MLDYLERLVQYSSSLGASNLDVSDVIGNLPQKWHSDDRIAAVLERGAQANSPMFLDQLLGALNPLALRSGCILEAAQRALETATTKGYAECCDALLERCGASLSVNQKSKSGMPLLMRAAWFGQDSVVCSLIKHRAAVDAREPGQRTALHFAALSGHLTVVRSLLAAGADPEAQDGDGWTALTEAENNGHTAVCEELRGLKSNESNPSSSSKDGASNQPKPPSVVTGPDSPKGGVLKAKQPSSPSKVTALPALPMGPLSARLTNDKASQLRNPFTARW